MKKQNKKITVLAHVYEVKKKPIWVKVGVDPETYKQAIEESKRKLRAAVSRQKSDSN